MASCYYFPAKLLYPHRPDSPAMAGIFEQLIKSKKQVLFVNQYIRPVDKIAQELQAAKEILGEVFGAEPEDVDEMIQARITELKGMY
jgi:hypothetical protein